MPKDFKLTADKRALIKRCAKNLLGVSGTARALEIAPRTFHRWAMECPALSPTDCQPPPKGECEQAQGHKAARLYWRECALALLERREKLPPSVLLHNARTLIRQLDSAPDDDDTDDNAIERIGRFLAERLTEYE